MTVENLQQYEDKNIILVRLLPEPNNEGHGVEELTGHAEKARDGVGVVLKPKGKSGVILIEPNEIDSITIIEPPGRSLKSKRLDPLEDNKVKQHLLDRHGYKLSWVNAQPEEEVVRVHNVADHRDLGHHHTAKPGGDGSEREAAIAAAIDGLN